MNSQDWVLLKMIAKERNITRASERLYLSQPALTYRIRQLENEFGEKLLIRTPNGVILTPQGEFLVDYANEMILRLDRTKELLTSFNNKVKGPLRIGSSAIFAYYELPSLLKVFLERFPEVEIFLQTGRSNQVVRLLEREEVSIAIVRGEHEWKYNKRLLCEEPICLVSRKAIPLEELPNRPRVVYGTDTSLQGLIEQWWRTTFSRPSRDSIVVDAMDTCKRMVQQGLGWAILPSIGLKELEELCVEPLYWPDGSPLIRRTWLCSAPYAEELPVLRSFASFVTEEFSNRKEKQRPTCP